MSKAVEDLLKAVRPEDSAASWVLRFVGSLDGVMTDLRHKFLMAQDSSVTGSAAEMLPDSRERSVYENRM